MARRTRASTHGARKRPRIRAKQLPVSVKERPPVTKVRQACESVVPDRPLEESQYVLESPARRCCPVTGPWCPARRVRRPSPRSIRAETVPDQSVKRLRLHPISLVSCAAVRRHPQQAGSQLHTPRASPSSNRRRTVGYPVRAIASPVAPMMVGSMHQVIHTNSTLQQWSDRAYLRLLDSTDQPGICPTCRRPREDASRPCRHCGELD